MRLFIKVFKTILVLCIVTLFLKYLFLIYISTLGCDLHPPFKEVEYSRQLESPFGGYYYEKYNETVPFHQNFESEYFHNFFSSYFGDTSMSEYDIEEAHSYMYSFMFFEGLLTIILFAMLLFLLNDFLTSFSKNTDDYIPFKPVGFDKIWLWLRRLLSIPFMAINVIYVIYVVVIASISLFSLIVGLFTLDNKEFLYRVDNWHYQPMIFLITLGYCGFWVLTRGVYTVAYWIISGFDPTK